MKVWAIVLLLAVGLVLLPGQQGKEEASSRVVVTAIGIDVGENEECRLSIQAVEPLKTAGSLTEQAENPTAVYTIEGPSVAGALQALVTRTGRRAYILHNRAIVLSHEQIRNRPLSALLDYFIRGHEGRATVDLVICRDSAAALLALPSAGYTIPAEHLAMLLQEGERQGFGVEATMLDVERSASGMFDAAIPIVRVVGEGEAATMEMDGTAVFRDERYCGDLNAAETQGLLFARGDVERCIVRLEYAGQPESAADRLTLAVERAKTTLSVETKGTAAAFTLRVTCAATLVEEYLPGSLPDTALPQVQEQLEAAIRDNIEAMLRTTVGEWGSDVCGFVRLLKKECPAVVRGHEEEWPERLKECRFDVQVTASVTKAGGEADSDPLALFE